MVYGGSCCCAVFSMVAMIHVLYQGYGHGEVNFMYFSPRHLTLVRLPVPPTVARPPRSSDPKTWLGLTRPVRTFLLRCGGRRRRRRRRAGRDENKERTNESERRTGKVQSNSHENEIINRPPVLDGKQNRFLVNV